MKGLDNLINWLESGSSNLFEIHNQETEALIAKAISAAEIKAKHGTVQAYFENLAKMGVNIVQIQQRVKNGSSTRKYSLAQNLVISTGANKNVAVGGRQVKAAATPQQYQKQDMQQQAQNSFPGLGYPDLYGKSESELAELKQKYEILQQEKHQLEKENLKLEMKLENPEKKEEKSTVDAFLENFMKNPEPYIKLATSFKGGATSNPGLNAPAQPQRPQLSDVKEKMISLISNPHVKNDHVSVAELLLNECLKDNTPFLKEYVALLRKFEVIQEPQPQPEN